MTLSGLDKHHPHTLDLGNVSALRHGRTGVAAAPRRILGRPLLPLLLLVCLVVLSGAGAGVVAARLPSGHGHGLGRLAPGPSVEDDNPLPPSVKSGHHQRRCSALPSRVLRQVLGPAFNPAYMAFSLEDHHVAVGASTLTRGPDRLDPRDTRGAADSPYGLGREHHDPYSPSLWSHAEEASPSRFAVDEDFSVVLSDEPAWHMRYEVPTAMLSADDVVEVQDTGGRPRGGYHGSRSTAGRRVRSDADQGDDQVEDAGPHVAEAATVAEELSRTVRAAWGSVGTLSKDVQWHCESPLRWIDLGPDHFPRYLRSADCSHHTCTGAGFVCRPRSFSVKVLRRREGACAPASDLPVEESTVGLPSDLRDLWVWELRAVNFCCVCSLRV